MTSPWPQRPGTQSRETGRRAARRPRGGKPALSRLSAARLIAGIVVLLGLCALSGLLATSQAAFVANSRNPGNLVQADTLEVVNSSGDAYVLQTDRLRPGQSVTETVALSNKGDFTARCTVHGGTTSDTPASAQLSSALMLSIDDVTETATSLWSGTIDDFTSLTLGPLAFGQTRSYRFTITFPQSTASPALQGASTSLDVIFQAMTQ